MNKFFPITIDNFFDNPDKIVEYAKSLPKEPNLNGDWPGTRTKRISEIDEILNVGLLWKITSSYYNTHHHPCEWARSSIFFQEIPAFSKDKNDVKNRGWIHHDDAEHDVAGVVYLTPNIDPDAGTSLFALKQPNLSKEDLAKQSGHVKNTLYKKHTLDEDYYKKTLEDYEKLFTETTRFANIYNRMVTYGTNYYHRANNFYNEDDPRLTLVFFLGGLRGTSPPIERIKGGKWDLIIESRLSK